MDDIRISDEVGIRSVASDLPLSDSEGRDKFLAVYTGEGEESKGKHHKNPVDEKFSSLDDQPPAEVAAILIAADDQGEGELATAYLDGQSPDRAAEILVEGAKQGAGGT